jgi:dienelactone hydrolase
MKVWKLSLMLWAASCAAQQDAWIPRILDTLHVPQPLPALRTERFGSFSPVAGVVAERVLYTTQLGMKVPAVVYRPAKTAGKLPGLIIVNGHGGDKFSWYAFYSGMMYAQAGGVVLTYDPVGEGERNSLRQSGTRDHDRILEPEEMGRWMGGLMITDVMQAVSYLASRSDVDATRIAAAGYSMGSFVLSIACAVETRLKACVLTGGGNLDGADGYWDKSKPMCQGIPYRSLMFLGDRAAALYALQAKRGPALVYNGLKDTTVNIPATGPPFFEDLRKRVAMVRGSEKNIFETGFLPDAAHRPYFVTKPVALWLEEHLDFPAWTRETLERMPVTHISRWAAREGVAMDKLYASEEREGGALAVGSGLPGIGREKLFVLPRAEWEKRKNELVYESWVEQARMMTDKR